MRKLFVTIVALLLMTPALYGQLSNIWEKGAGEFTWFAADNNTRGMGYNPATNHLLVASRTGGANIWIVDAATGDSLGKLDMTGVAGGTFPVNIVRATSDGVIYAGNLQVTAGSNFKIYRWADEAAVPTVAFDGPVNGRTGDSFGLYGSGTATILYASGSGNAEMTVFETTDGENFTISRNVAVTAGLARGGISPVGESMGAELWVNGSGTAVSHIDTTGALINAVSTSVISTGFHNVAYMSSDTLKYIAITGTAGAADTRKLFVYDIRESETDPVLYAEAELASPANTNANAAADLAFKDNGDNTITIYQMVTNNAIAAWTLQLPVPPSPISNLWEKAVGDLSFLQTDNNTRGMGYNPVTNHLLVASRTGGANIWILDAATGDSLGKLDMTGVSGGTFPINIVKATADGVIYAGNLQVTAGSNFKIYRWADESAVPTVAFDGPANARTGDAFNVTGTGAGTIIYASGSGSTEVTRFTTTDGLTFAIDTPIPVAAGLARGGISPVPEGATERSSRAERAIEELWVNGSGTPTSHIDASGNVISQVNTAVLAGSWYNVQYLVGGGKQFIAVVGNGGVAEGKQVQFFDISDSETDPVLYTIGELTAPFNTNANAAGDLAYRNNGDSTFTVYQLVTNNGIAAWEVEIPEVGTPVVTIAQIQTTPDGGPGPSPLQGQVVQTSGIVTGTNNNGFFIQDGPGAWNGLWVFSPGHTATVGDDVTIEGEVDEFFDLTEMLNLSSFVVNSQGNALPAPEVVATGDYPVEKYEGVLVQVQNAVATNPDRGFGEWEVDDGSGMAVVDDFLFAFTPDSGQAYNITAIGYYSFNEYKMQPRDSSDIVAVSANPVSGLWEKVVDDFVWLKADNNTRGMGYNPVTNHLLVASRTGGANIWILDAASGDSLGKLDMTGVSGGTFPINIVKAAMDGVIYAGNLQVTAGSNFKLYRWADESAVPTVAFDGPVNARTGDALDVYGAGVNTVVFASGGGSTEILRLVTADGENFTAAAPVPVAAGLARGGISAIPGMPVSELWVNGSGTATTHIDTAGTVISQTDGAVVAASWMNVKYALTDNGDKFIAVAGNAGADLGNVIQVWNITASETTPELFGTGELSIPFNANPNGAGDAAWVNNGDGTFTLFQLSTNNGVAAYLVDVPGEGAPAPVFSATSLDFDTTYVEAPQTLSFTIENVGGTDVEILSVSLSTTVFTTGLTAGAIINPDSTLFVDVTFAPEEEVSYNDSLVIITNAGSASIALSGTGKVLWPINWRANADTSGWFGTANLVRTVAYSQATNNLYIVSRVGGNFVKVFNAETGAFVKDLDMTGFVGSGLIHINMAAADGDGVIYAANLAQGSPFTLFRWENEDAPLTTAFSGILDGRVGDIISLSGKGADTEIYVSGSNNASAFVLGTSDGINFSVVDTIPLPEAGSANFGLSPVMDGEYFFTNAPGKAPRYIKRSGEVLKEFDTAEISGTSISYFEINTTDNETRRFIATLDGFSPGMRVVELLGAPGDSLASDFAIQPANTPKYVTNANGNATAQAVYNPVNNSLIELVTNNGITSYSFEKVVPNDTIIVGIQSDDLTVPLAYDLRQNYPNPFNPTTTIELALPERADVRVIVYNALGQKVGEIFNGNLNAGQHKFTFDARGLASGMYFYRVNANSFTAVKKMLLIK